ncbi:MAG TPA: N-acyl homoserine lactonase family protein [Actinomycetota bacterium]|jgi:glyoxylase-like metal-dependent hydrolase (beta-lactamase superfamily II)|nr:N-acyl homoserine lactonase family protein [Actinomycetota bacterium]
MRVHVIQTGRLIGNKTFMRGQSWSSLFRKADRYEFPAYCYILEHPDGHIAIDTGMTSRARTPRIARRFVPTPIAEPEDEVGPQMRAKGLDPADVRLVVVSHLDWDHVGGVGHFPNAEVLVHRREFEFASTFQGRMRYQPKLWPHTFDPTLFGLDPEPFGPFPESKTLTDKGDVRLVPIPGHSVAQVGTIVQTKGPALFFGADHMLRQDWFLEDVEAGRLIGLGLFFREKAIETSKRIAQFMDEVPTILLPAHDADAGQRLAAFEPIKI